MPPVVLTIPGAEPLMPTWATFGRRPNRARLDGRGPLPALLLCYAGQAALLLERSGGRLDQAFFPLAPALGCLWPLLALKPPAATVDRHQSRHYRRLFSITQPGDATGYLTRLKIVHNLRRRKRGPGVRPGRPTAAVLASPDRSQHSFWPSGSSTALGFLPFGFA